MQLYPEMYYHIYNRTNNNELLFKSEENYLYFLRKYRQHLETLLQTLAYCLMPTHFHFLVYIKTEDTDLVKKKIGIWLNGYTKAINKVYQRHGSLFQRHTKAKVLEDESYLLNLVTYIHQNPVRKGLVTRLEDWPFSSYPDYIGIRHGSLVNRGIVMSLFGSTEEFKHYSEELISEIDRRYWI